MAQCDVFMNEGESRNYAPYLLDIQANILRDLDTRVVVPLVKESLFRRRISRLHPLFEIGRDRVVMATHLLAAIGKADLGPLKASLPEHRDAIIDAVDVIRSGV